MNNSENKTKNIVLHDIFDIRGGGERLALSLVAGLKADLGIGKTSVNSFNLEKHSINKIYNLDLKIEFPGLKTWALSQLFKKRTEFLEDYQNVIYSGITSPLAIKNHENGTNYLYCHTPPRFIYDKYEHYLKQYYLPQQLMMKLLVSWFKPQYESAVGKMDVIITNSKFVKARIKKYLKHDSIVVYPPCNINSFSYQRQNGYYLSTARLDSLKRIDKIIAAFKMMPDKKLIICSSGPELERLKKIANTYDNIKFTGQVSDNKLKHLIEQSIATIYIPEDEDFGMSPVESMAAGKPVICSGHGGPTESVVNNETGYFISEENIVQSLVDHVIKLDANQSKKMQLACEKRAKLFSEKIFHKKIQEIIET